jgi:TrfA protein
MGMSSVDNLDKKLKQLQVIAEKKKGSALLPQWADANRAAPNEIVRSALFNARNKNHKRTYLKQAEIAVIGNGYIKYTGEELRQDDETVWLQILHFAKEKPLEDIIEFTAYSILKSMGWPTTAFYYKKLEDSLNRMSATNVVIESERLGKACGVSIIRKYEKSGDGTLWRVWIEREMKHLFDGNFYTLTEWEQRLALPTGLATWLHAYLASHKKPYDIKIETIVHGSGLTTVEKKHATEKIKNALKNLEAVGFLKSWKIEDGKISVQRSSE